MQYLMSHQFDREGRAVCFTLNVFLVSLGCYVYVTLPHDTVGLSAECDGGTCIS